MLAEGGEDKTLVLVEMVEMVVLVDMVEIQVVLI